MFLKARIRSFSRAEPIFLQGERASAIYIVAEGRVKLYRIASSAAKAMVRVFTMGSRFRSCRRHVFTCMALLRRGRR
jgi:CRP-like cAMP-binding protein